MVGPAIKAAAKSFYRTVDTPTSKALPDATGNPTYRKNVLNYRRNDGQQSDYLMHTETYDEDFDNLPTRVVQGIKSEGSAVNDTPYEKTWLKKGIERELATALEEGREQIAIPIKGYDINDVNINEDLARSPSTQKWYEETVLPAAEKIAKETNSDFVYKAQEGVSQAEFISAYNELIKMQNAAGVDTMEELLQMPEYADKAKVLYQTYTRPQGIEYAIIKPRKVEETLETKQLVSNEKSEERVNAFEKFMNLSGEDETVVKNTLKKEQPNLSDKEINTLVEFLSTDNITNEMAQTINKLTYQKPKPRFDFTVYSPPAATAFVAYEAYKAGMSREQVEAKMVERFGYDEEDLQEINNRVEVITEASAAGMTLEEIRQKFNDRELQANVATSVTMRNDVDTWTDPQPFKETPKKIAYKEINEATGAKELLSSLQTVYPTLTLSGLYVPAWYGDKGAQQRLANAEEQSRNKIISFAKEKYNKDFFFDNGEWFLNTEQGPVTVTPTLWDDIKKDFNEIAGGLTGAIAGAKFAALVGQAGPQAAFPEEILTVPVGAVTGGLLGAMIGSEADYLREAMNIHADMSAEVAAFTALNAFEAGIVGEMVGVPAAYATGFMTNVVKTAKDYIIQADTRAAYQALKDTMFLDDSQIEDIVLNVEKQVNLEGNKYEKAIQAVTVTQPGMQKLVNESAKFTSKTPAVISKGITKRAEEIISLTNSDMTPVVFKEDLANYVSDVKKNYAFVKSRATQSPKANNFVWDYEELAISPVLEDLYTKIVDPSVKQKFINQLDRIQALSESNKFGDIIELRQMVNDFLYNKRIVKADDKKTLRTVLNSIDSAIEDGAYKVVDNPKQWLKDWATVRKDYSEMKKVEQTALYKTIFDKQGKVKPVQPETIVKAMGKYITALDGSFEAVIEKLPPASRKTYETAVIDSLVARFTAGEEAGAQAIHFPLLARELNKISFTSPEGRATKKALTDMAEVFKNDVYLAQTSGAVTIPKFQSYLTTDPVVRFKYEVASSVFNSAKSKFPGEGNRQLALVKETARLLQDPLDEKAFSALQKEVFDNATLNDQMLALRQETAKMKAKGLDVSGPSTKVYVGGKLEGSGKFTEIPTHRIATLEQVQNIADQEAVTVNSRILDSILKKYGYIAAMKGSDRVRLLGD